MEACQCGKKFKKKTSLYAHGTHCDKYQAKKKKKTKYKIDENLYRCECNREFNSSQSLNGHLSHCNKHRKAIGKKEFNDGERLSHLDGKRSWSKGLTKDEHPAIKKVAEKLSERYSGVNAHWYGRSHTKETKEKIRKARIHYLQNNNSNWYEVQNLNGIKIKVQGTWEREVSKWLNNKEILFERNSIRFCKNRKYTPDFYLPEYNEYIEVKGYFYDKAKYKMFKVLEDNDIIIRMIDKDIYYNLDEYNILNLPIFEEKYKYENINFEKFQKQY